MARRSDHSRDEIKDMAIRAGQLIITNEGYAGFSARKVARAIGYTVGTLYNVFENHDDIIMHINAVTLCDMHHDISKQLQNSDDSHAVIKQLAYYYLSFARDNKHRWNALFMHITSDDSILPPWYNDHLTTLFSLIEAPLHNILPPSANHALAAKTMWAAIHGICALGLSNKLHMPNGMILEQLMDNLVENYMAGLTQA